MNFILLSHFKKHIKDFIEQKHACGFLYKSPIHWLLTFDRFCQEHYSKETQLTQKLVMHWAQRLPNEHLKTLESRIVVVRQLAKYLNQIGYVAYIIPFGILPKIPRYVPHNYTEQELKLFFTAIDQYTYISTSPARHLVVPVIFRVLYCCGLRSSEATGLKVSDVDLEIGKLTIRQAKGNKGRVVMLSQDILHLCRIYHEKINLIFPIRLYFFPNPIGDQYGEKFLATTFHACWNKAGISYISGNPPRVHDFRHGFAVKRLNIWVQEGKDVNAYLPYLSMYLGHASLSGTDYYLHLVPEFFPMMMSQAEEQFSHLIPEVNDEE